MITMMRDEDLSKYVNKQLCLFFPDVADIQMMDIGRCIKEALDRVEYCFGHINNKYYVNRDNEAIFNHLNGDHYATFLYYLSNTIWVRYGNEDLSSRVFLLNKALHGIDLFYEISMPDIFLMVHPLGTVLGRASYSNYLIIYQGCTVGSVVGNGYPDIGEHFTMYSNSSLLGDCNVGDNVIMGSNSYLINTSVSNNKVVVGQHPDTRIYQNKLSKQSVFEFK
jgi:serine O-acetyltransferase